MERAAAMAALGVLLLASGAARADLRAQFIEGAPKDRFVFENVGACAIAPARLVLDLAPSRGRLIFDVTAAGAGVEVFQPLEIIEGADALEDVPIVRDGDDLVAFTLRGLEPGARIAFTIDVDDRLGGREITVSGGEIEGARLKLERDGAVVEGSFTRDGVALAPDGACVAGGPVRERYAA